VPDPRNRGQDPDKSLLPGNHLVYQLHNDLDLLIQIEDEVKTASQPGDCRFRKSCL
jgi:hypothetical protein